MSYLFTLGFVLFLILWSVYTLQSNEIALLGILGSCILRLNYRAHNTNLVSESSLQLESSLSHSYSISCFFWSFAMFPLPFFSFIFLSLRFFFRSVFFSCFFLGGGANFLFGLFLFFSFFFSFFLQFTCIE